MIKDHPNRENFLATHPIAGTEPDPSASTKAYLSIKILLSVINIEQINPG